LSIQNLLAAAADRLARAGADSPKLCARILLATAMGVAREELIVAEREPTTEESARFEAMVARRAAREPLAYVTGTREFWSLDFQVGPGVLVPRPETETLIEAALKTLPDRNAPLRIADFGSGSGALLIAALKEFPRARGQGFERSPKAFAYAKANLERHNLAVRADLVAGDWSEAAENGFDVIFCNPPYIPGAEIEQLEPEVRLFEPRGALDGGPDGLDAYRSLSRLLPRALSPGGLAFVELGQGQELQVKPLIQKLIVLHVAPDLAGIPRVLVLEKPK
jgi:release factor glutamine methyltransferase